LHRDQLAAFSEPLKTDPSDGRSLFRMQGQVGVNDRHPLSRLSRDGRPPVRHGVHSVREAGCREVEGQGDRYIRSDRPASEPAQPHGIVAVLHFNRASENQ
jgi:hypothetical protein